MVLHFINITCRLQKENNVRKEHKKSARKFINNTDPLKLWSELVFRKNEDFHTPI